MRAPSLDRTDEQGEQIVDAWTDGLRTLAGGRSSKRMVPSKGVHVFVAGERIPMETGLLARTEKSVLFVVPFQGGWLIGDTDTPWTAGPDEVVATGPRLGGERFGGQLVYQYG